MREFIYDGKLWVELLPGVFMEAKRSPEKLVDHIINEIELLESLKDDH